MAKKGQTIWNSKTGEKITWIETAADTNGERLVFDFHVAPHGKLPVIHFHPFQDETFVIHKGFFTINLNGEIIKMTGGDRITIKKGVPHQWWNESDEATEMTVTFEPALNTETFLEQFFGLANSNRTKSDGTPDFFQIMSMINEYKIYVAGPPLPVQIVMGHVIGGVARLFGMKKYYPEYSR